MNSRNYYFNKQKRVRIPVHLLGEDEQYIYDYLLIKQQFSNGIIYDPRIHRIQKRLHERGFKEYTQTRLRRLFSWFKKDGIVTVDEVSGVWVFQSNKKRRTVSTKIKDIRYTVRKYRILSNLRQQQFARDTKKNLIYPKGRFAYQEHKKAKRNRKKLNGDTSVFNLDLMLGYRTMAELIDMSPSTAVRVVQRMKGEGIVDIKTATNFRRRSDNFLKRTPNSYILFPNSNKVKKESIVLEED
jgi:hypothetical protein